MLTAWSLLVLITASHCNPLENGETVLAQNTNQNITVDTNGTTDIVLNVLLDNGENNTRKYFIDE